MALGQQTQTKGAVFGVTGFGVPQPVAKPFTGESGKVEKHLFSEFLTPKTPVVFGAPSGSVSTGFSTKSNAGEVQNVIPFNFSSPVPNSPFESQLSSSIGSSGISTSRDDNEESIDEDSEEEEEQVCQAISGGFSWEPRRVHCFFIPRLFHQTLEYLTSSFGNVINCLLSPASDKITGKDAASSQSKSPKAFGSKSSEIKPIESSSFKAKP